MDADSIEKNILKRHVWTQFFSKYGKEISIFEIPGYVWTGPRILSFFTLAESNNLLIHSFFIRTIHKNIEAKKYPKIGNHSKNMLRTC